MGYQVGLACYSDPASAATAYYSGTSPVATATGYTAFEYVNSQWQLDTYQTGSSGAVLVSGVAVTPSLGQCDPESQFVDGVGLGWLVMTPLVLAFGYQQIKRYF